jgi:predicted nucleic acid-binding protein
VSAARAAGHVEVVAESPVVRHPLPDLLAGAWARRQRLRVVDALYVELADRLGLRILTTDAGLARASRLAELVTA